MAAARTSKKTDPEGAFAAVVAGWKGQAGIDVPRPSQRAFGSNALKVGGKIFAMLVRGAFVVKLPKAQVDVRVDAGQGTRFEPRPGKAMTEWLVVGTPEDTWAALAREAHAYVTRTSRTRAAARAPKPRSRS